MKGFLVAVGLAAVYCWWTHHSTKRHILGGQKCITCKRTFADLEDAGTLPDGRITKRTKFYRENGSIERSPWHVGE